MATYTIMHRKSGNKRLALLGYRSKDLNSIRHIARQELESGLYKNIRIIDATTGKLVEKVSPEWFHA